MAPRKWNKPRDIAFPVDERAVGDINENFDKLFLALRNSPVGVGTLPVDNGGTGLEDVPIGDLLVGQGTPVLGLLPDIATGSVLLSGGVGAPPAYGKVGLTTHVSGTLPVVNGGTGLATIPTGDLVVGQGTSALATLADVTTGNALISGGVGASPSYGKIGLTTHVSGTLPIANGGTDGTTALAAFDNLSPLTTKGDVLTRNTTNNIRVAVGTNGFALIADSAQAAGLKWAKYDAGDLAGTTLAATVVTSSLTSVGTLTSLTVSGTVTAGTVSVESDTPTFLFKETDEGTDTKYWRIIGSAGVFNIQAVDDALGAGSTALLFTRSAAAVTGVRLQTGGTARLLVDSVGTVDMRYGLMLSGQQSITVSADQTAWSPTGLGSSYYFSTTSSGAPRTIKGILAQAAGTYIVVVNVGSNSLTFNHEDGTATAADRIRCPGGVNIAIVQYGSVHLTYDGISSRWHVISWE